MLYGFIKPRLEYSALLIADYFLAHSTKPLTVLHLIKLTYIAHGFVLGFTKSPLIRDRVEAWKYGPVIPTLYHAYKGYGGGGMCLGLGIVILNFQAKTESRKEFLKSRIDPKIRNVLDQILEIYDGFSALQLSAVAHKPGSPWAQCRKPGHFFTWIPHDVLQEYYEKKIQAGKA